MGEIFIIVFSLLSWGVLLALVVWNFNRFPYIILVWRFSWRKFQTTWGPPKKHNTGRCSPLVPLKKKNRSRRDPKSYTTSLGTRNWRTNLEVRDQHAPPFCTREGGYRIEGFSGAMFCDRHSSQNDLTMQVWEVCNLFLPSWFSKNCIPSQQSNHFLSTSAVIFHLYQYWNQSFSHIKTRFWEGWRSSSKTQKANSGTPNVGPPLHTTPIPITKRSQYWGPWRNPWQGQKKRLDSTMTNQHLLDLSWTIETQTLFVFCFTSNWKSVLNSKLDHLYAVKNNHSSIDPR